MKLTDGLYRIGAYLRHYLTAGNTLGHGIHSPKLYYIVRFLFYDNNAYYCFHDIEKERLRLLRASKMLAVDDYGTGMSGQRTIAYIADTSLAPAREAQLLFRLVNHIKPAVIVELGTSLGITTAYLAKAAPHAGIITFEGSHAIAEEAKKVWQNLKVNNTTLICGNIDDALPLQLKDIEKVDFALIDANHTEEATLRYFGLLLSKCHENSIIVIDDIHNSIEMNRAWNKCRKNPQVTSSFDLYGMGMLFLDKQLLPKHYTLRI